MVMSRHVTIGVGMSGPPREYPLFKVGDVIQVYPGVSRTITAEMTGLLGTADNTVARIPSALIEHTRHLVAVALLSNHAVMPHDQRFNDSQPHDPSWVDSSILYLNRDVAAHAFLKPVQSGKTMDQAMGIWYAYLVQGAAPVLTVRSTCGRQFGGGDMARAISERIGPDCAVGAMLPSVKDFIQQVVLSKGAFPQFPTSLFFLSPTLQPGGARILLPGARIDYDKELPIILHNPAGVGKINQFIKYMLDAYGPKDGRARVALFMDEADLGFSGNHHSPKPVERTLYQFLQRILMLTMFSGTLTTVALSQRAMQVYTPPVPSNYYGVVNDRIDYETVPLANLRALEFSDAFRTFPPMGPALAQMVGRGTSMMALLTKLTMQALLHMLRHPNHVMNRWCHANIQIAQSRSQQTLAKYFASASDFHPDCARVVTAEWHSRYVACNDGGRAVQIRMYMKPAQWLACRTAWICAGVWDDIRPRLSVGRLSRADLRRQGIIPPEPTATPTDPAPDPAPDPPRFSSIVQVDLIHEDDGLPQMIGMMARVRAPVAGAPVSNVTLVVMSGEVNGRQVANKSPDHSTNLTHQVSHVNVHPDNLNASKAGANVMQGMRVCTVTTAPLNNNPVVFCTDETREFIESAATIQRDTVQMAADLADDDPDLTVLDALGQPSYRIDRTRYPMLARLKARADEQAKKKRPVVPKQLVPSPAVAKTVGDVLSRARTPVSRPARPVELPQLSRQIDPASAGPPASAKRAREYEKLSCDRLEKRLISDLKSATKYALGEGGRIAPGLEVWVELITELFQSRDFSQAIDVSPRDPAIRAVISGGHGIAVPTHMCSPDSPGGLFFRRNNGWTMKDSIQTALACFSPTPLIPALSFPAPTLPTFSYPITDWDTLCTAVASDSTITEGSRKNIQLTLRVFQSLSFRLDPVFLSQCETQALKNDATFSSYAHKTWGSNADRHMQDCASHAKFAGRVALGI